MPAPRLGRCASWWPFAQGADESADKASCGAMMTMVLREVWGCSGLVVCEGNLLISDLLQKDLVPLSSPVLRWCCIMLLKASVSDLILEIQESKMNGHLQGQSQNVLMKPGEKEQAWLRPLFFGNSNEKGAVSSMGKTTFTGGDYIIVLAPSQHMQYPRSMVSSPRCAASLFQAVWVGGEPQGSCEVVLSKTSAAAVSTAGKPGLKAKHASFWLFSCFLIPSIISGEMLSFLGSANVSVPTATWNNSLRCLWDSDTTSQC